VQSSLRRAQAGESAEANDLQLGEVFGACQRGRRYGGLQAVGLQPGVEVICSSARIGVGESAVACRSTARRRGDMFLGACRRGGTRDVSHSQERAKWVV